MDELIRVFDLQSELPAVDDSFLRAVSAMAGGDAVRLETWMGVEKVTFDLVDDKTEWDRAAVEWLERAGRFHLNVRIMARVELTTAQFARSLSRELGSCLLFGDCEIYPFSYLMSDAGGAIWHVVLRHNDEDAFDLLPDDPAAGEHFKPALLAAPDAPLPRRLPGFGPRPAPPDFCVVFHGPCPKAKTPCPRI